MKRAHAYVLIAGSLLGTSSAAAQSNFGTIVLRSGFTPDPHIVNGVSGGSQPASNLAPGCRGFVTAQPDHILNLTTPFTFLRIFAESAADTTLVVQQPTGAIVCNDDTYGRNPAIEGTFPAGTYRIWIGSYHAGQHAQYQLKLTELRAVVPGGGAVGVGVVAGPNPGLDVNARRGNFRPVSLRSGFLPDPRRLTGTSGGAFDAAQLGGGCRGWVAARPDHVVTLRSGFNFLRMYVSSQADTTLVVRTPDGRWLCNDDTFGTNPSIESPSWGPGRYLVWVGSYQQGVMAPYQIFFTELPTNGP
ncbi:MAG: hypothetical protein NZ898_03295 [Myxococcota bacterium]|nr:hypothetical protein [Myxococcota bacterium]MDW8361749.1 hypothetical protein [Myxococcales bacterium]